jgi:hypothetical protein
MGSSIVIPPVLNIVLVLVLVVVLEAERKSVEDDDEDEHEHDAWARYSHSMVAGGLEVTS